MESHVEHLALVLQALLDHHFYLKESKCSFGQTQIEYLGHIVCPEGVKPKATKIEAVMN